MRAVSIHTSGFCALLGTLDEVFSAHYHAATFRSVTRPGHADERNVNLVLMGPPGCGKGTQANRVAQSKGVPVIGTGDMLRRSALAPTPLGRAVKLLMDRGELIDDEVMIEILSERIVLPDVRRGFVLDGFPERLTRASRWTS